MRKHPSSLLLLTLLVACGGGGGSPSWNTDAAGGSSLGDSGETAAPAPVPAPTPAPSPSPAPAPAPTPAPPPPPAAACSTLPLCDGFESGSVGAAPDAGRWSIGGPNCFSGAGRASIDNTQARSGSQSVRIDPGSDYCGHVFIGSGAMAGLGAVRFGRFWLRLAQPIGDAHVTLVSMRDANDSTASQSQELRIGGQNGILMWNRSRDDATLPTLSPAGIATSLPLPAQTWTCIEFRIDQDSGTLQTWVDGNAPAGLQQDGAPTADVDQAWLAQLPGWRPALSHLKIGWEAYGGATNTVWIDDVALAATRIGCN